MNKNSSSTTNKSDIFAKLKNQFPDDAKSYVNVCNLRSIHLIFVLLVIVLIYVNIINYNNIIKTLLIVAVVIFGIMDTWNILINVLRPCDKDLTIKQQCEKIRNSK